MKLKLILLLLFLTATVTAISSDESSDSEDSTVSDDADSSYEEDTSDEEQSSDDELEDSDELRRRVICVRWKRGRCLKHKYKTIKRCFTQKKNICKNIRPPCVKKTRKVCDFGCKVKPKRTCVGGRKICKFRTKKVCIPRTKNCSKIVRKFCRFAQRCRTKKIRICRRHLKCRRVCVKHKIQKKCVYKKKYICKGKPKKPPASWETCWSSGDPHIKAFHIPKNRLGKGFISSYDTGDFVLFRGGGVEVHERHISCGPKQAKASCNSAMAVKYRGQIVVVTNRNHVFVNGKRNFSRSKKLASDMVMKRGKRVEVKCGKEIVVAARGNNKMLDVLVRANKNAVCRKSGLCGCTKQCGQRSYNCGRQMRKVRVSKANKAWKIRSGSRLISMKRGRIAPKPGKKKWSYIRALQFCSKKLRGVYKNMCARDIQLGVAPRAAVLKAYRKTRNDVRKTRKTTKRRNWRSWKKKIKKNRRQKPRRTRRRRNRRYKKKKRTPVRRRRNRRTWRSRRYKKKKRIPAWRQRLMRLGRRRRGQIRDTDSDSDSVSRRRASSWRKRYLSRLRKIKNRGGKRCYWKKTRICTPGPSGSRCFKKCTRVPQCKYESKRICLKDVSKCKKRIFTKCRQPGIKCFNNRYRWCTRLPRKCTISTSRKCGPVNCRQWNILQCPRIIRKCRVVKNKKCKVHRRKYCVSQGKRRCIKWKKPKPSPTPTPKPTRKPTPKPTPKPKPKHHHDKTNINVNVHGPNGLKFHVHIHLKHHKHKKKLKKHMRKWYWKQQKFLGKYHKYIGKEKKHKGWLDRQLKFLDKYEKYDGKGKRRTKKKRVVMKKKRVVKKK